jgi:hypothetical protein
MEEKDGHCFLDDVIMELELKAVDEVVPTCMTIYKEAIEHKRDEVIHLTREIESLDSELEAIKHTRELEEETENVTKKATEKAKSNQKGKSDATAKTVHSTKMVHSLDSSSASLYEETLACKKKMTVHNTSMDDETVCNTDNDDVSIDEEALACKKTKKMVCKILDDDALSSSDIDRRWCASGSRYTQPHNAADAAKHKCPACHRAVHSICGPIEEDASCVLYKTTCWPCYAVMG